MRKHYSHNHPAVQAWTADDETKKRQAELMEPHIAKWEKRRKAARQRRLAQWGVRFRATTGLATIIVAGLEFDRATREGDPLFFAFFLVAAGGMMLLTCISPDQ